MPDFLAVLQGLGGQGATLVKGKVTAVSTGRLTVEVNGGEFTRVPYMQGGWTPAVDEQVYLLAQQGFGMLALGSPVIPDADAALPATTTATVDPDTVGNWSARAQAWTVPLDGILTQADPYALTGAWFYDTADFSAWTTQALATVEMQLEVVSGTPQLALLRNQALTGDPDTYSGPLPVTATLGAVEWVPLPLSWGADLISGAATGIAATSQSYEAVLDLHGSIRLTSL